MNHPYSEPSTETELVEEARRVLQNNLLGVFTKPAPSLYPHQWNWDAGFIALGWAPTNFRQACSEMTALFRGQWDNGMVPQIVFSVKNVGKYFPGYRFWETNGLPGKPRNTRTSGLTMPAVHGFILQRLLEQAPDVGAARPFFRRMYDRVLLLHNYLYTLRDPNREGLAFICHPWESGMDNLPTWETVFETIRFDPEKDVPPYTRMDLLHVDAPFRPRKESYDRYIYLVHLLRKSKYKKPELWGDYPFKVQEPMFNAILNHSNEAMIELGRWLGRDTGQLREWYDQTNNAINNKLWDEQRGVYVSYDLVQQKQVPVVTAAGILPLLCGAPDAARAKRLIDLIQGPKFNGTPENPTWLCASTALDEPGFDPCRYWRGPVWINMNWMMYHAMLRYGQPELAERLRNDSLELVRRHGFWEYYNPLKNQSVCCGSDQFSWTAALVIDWLRK